MSNQNSGEVRAVQLDFLTHEKRNASFLEEEQVLPTQVTFSFITQPSMFLIYLFVSHECIYFKVGAKMDFLLCFFHSYPNETNQQKAIKWENTKKMWSERCDDPIIMALKRTVNNHTTLDYGKAN